MMRFRTSLHEIGRLAVACLLPALGAGACVAAESSDSPDAGAAIVYGLTHEPAGFDPHHHRSISSGIVARQVYDTLLYRDPVSRELVPGLAESWALSGDDLVLSVKLRPDVRFHDGTALNASAVAFNLERILATTGSDHTLNAFRQRASRFNVIDDYRLEIVLGEPWSPLPDALTQPGFAIASPTALTSLSTARYQFHQVGSGPFLFQEYVPGERLLLRRNPDYAWGPTFYSAAPVNAIETVEFRFIAEASAREAALRAGVVHLAGGLHPDDLPALNDLPGLRLEFVPVAGQPLQFIMNTGRVPTSLRALRQALIFGTSRSAIANAGGQRLAPVAWGPLAESTLFAYNALRGLYAQDRQQADSLLSGLGFEDSDNDGWLELAGAPLQLEVLVPPRDALPQVASLVSEQWRFLGIRTRLVPVPTETGLREAVQRGDYHLVAFAAKGYDPAWLYDWFGIDTGLNWSGYRNEELDSMLRNALSVSDDRTRYSLYARAQQIIMDQALVLPLREQVNIVAIADGLDGLLWDATGMIPLLNNLTRAWPSPET